jgi:hypothetical protein
MLAERAKPNAACVRLASAAACLLVGVTQAQLPYGPDTCSQGYVWREAFPGDHACVTPKTRAQASSDNGEAGARRQPGGGPYGPDTCRRGYVWREARPDDHVCVTPETRAETASDNRQAANRLAGRDENPEKEEQTYFKPRWFDDRLDWCLNWASDCGQPAADNFCKRRRFTGAAAFEADPKIGRTERTRVSGTNQVCNEESCTGFKFITCRGRISATRVYANPTWKGYRLDVCLKWGTECGKPAADAFCRTERSPDSFYFVVDADAGGSRTRVIGTDQICDKDFCRGFQMIICQ